MRELTKKHMAHQGKGRVRMGVIALAVLVVLTGLALWVRNNSGTTSNAGTTPQSGAMTRTNEGGQITIKVTWQGRDAGPVFTVEMDTHAVNLDGYNLQQLAVLRIDQQQEMQPSGWNAPTGGHHRSGILSFPATTASGTPVIGSNTRLITLLIRNVGNVPERVFTWTR
jgi:hypothetical protein